jgi:hypothetical protein
LIRLDAAVGCNVYGIYMANCVACYRFYMVDAPIFGTASCLDESRDGYSAAKALGKSKPMLDIIYLLVGAVFLGACVGYAKACDHL